LKTIPGEEKLNFNKKHQCAKQNKTDILQLHHYELSSNANGPGDRAVIWVQGCSLRCPGCFNNSTHDPSGGFTITVTELYDKVVNGNIGLEGVTISGGEPLEQRTALIKFLSLIRTSNLSVIILTGYTWQEINTFPESEQIIGLSDLIIAGRYEQDNRMASNLLGSTNQTFHFLTARYSLRDFADLPEAEILIRSNGTISITGINPLNLSAYLV
jgi:anaerobic ribonucleoside-triphosphate reductase activating protein